MKTSILFPSAYVFISNSHILYNFLFENHHNFKHINYFIKSDKTKSHTSGKYKQKCAVTL